MSKKAFFLVVLMTMSLSSCGDDAPDELSEFIDPNVDAGSEATDASCQVDVRLICTRKDQDASDAEADAEETDVTDSALECYEVLVSGDCKDASSGSLDVDLRCFCGKPMCPLDDCRTCENHQDCGHPGDGARCNNGVCGNK